MFFFSLKIKMCVNELTGRFLTKFSEFHHTLPTKRRLIDVNFHVHYTTISTIQHTFEHRIFSLLPPLIIYLKFKLLSAN